MKELLERKKEIKIQISKMDNQLKSIRQEMIKKSNPIINVMQKVERDVIDMDEFKDFKYIGSLDLDPVRVIWDVNDYKIKGNFLKIHSGKGYCGGYSRWIIKIPLKYFDMSLEDVKKEHTEWSLSEVRSRIKRYKIREKNEKLRKIEELKKELNEYEN
jgi:hypothetical protein